MVNEEEGGFGGDFFRKLKTLILVAYVLNDF